MALALAVGLAKVGFETVSNRRITDDADFIITDDTCTFLVVASVVCIVHDSGEVNAVLEFGNHPLLNLASSVTVSSIRRSILPTTFGIPKAWASRVS